MAVRDELTRLAGRQREPEPQADRVETGSRAGGSSLRRSRPCGGWPSRSSRASASRSRRRCGGASASRAAASGTPRCACGRGRAGQADRVACWMDSWGAHKVVRPRVDRSCAWGRSYPCGWQGYQTLGCCDLRICSPPMVASGNARSGASSASRSAMRSGRRSSSAGGRRSRRRCRRSSCRGWACRRAPGPTTRRWRGTSGCR